MTCSNGRSLLREPRPGERRLVCGCPLGAPQRECLEAVAVKVVSPKVGAGH